MSSVFRIDPTGKTPERQEVLKNVSPQRAQMFVDDMNKHTAGIKELRGISYQATK